MLWWTLRQLRSKNISTRWAASEKLVAARAIGSLARMLADRNSDIRFEAELVLKEIDNRWYRTPEAKAAASKLISAILKGDASIREDALKALNKIEPNWRRSEAVETAVDTYIRLLGSYREQDRKKAVEALEMLGNPRAIPSLVGILCDRDSYLSYRHWAVAALNTIDPNWRNSEAAKAAVPKLIADLNHADPEVIEAAANALGVIRDPLAVQPLIALLNRRDFKTESTAAYALGHIGDSRAVDSLVKAFKSKDPVPAGACALGDIGDKRAVPTLVKGLRHKLGFDRGCAAEGLEALKWQPRDEQENRLFVAALCLSKLKVDDPECFSCGDWLGGGKPIFDSGSPLRSTFVISSRPVNEVRNDYRLYRGSVCFKCMVVLCVKCLGKRVEQCPQCQGETKPAYSQHLKELHDLAVSTK